MALIDYPISLPRPQASIVTPAERRQLSDEQRPRFARAIQRDRREFEQLTWPPMSAADVATFRQWWKEDLSLGGAWFNATWPLPRGFVAAVRKFVKPPQRTYLGRGFWRMTAVCEVRGRSLPVQRDLGIVVHWDTVNTLGIINFTNDDRTATTSVAGSMCIDSLGIGAGKYYGEILLEYLVDEGPAITVQMGITQNDPGNFDNFIGIGITGDVHLDGALVDTVSPLPTGTVLGFALDTNASKYWISVDGTWISGNPATGVGESGAMTGINSAYLFFFVESIEAPYAATLATSNAQFQYAPPSGFSQWAS